MRVISFAAVLFAAIFAVVVGYRIDQATLAILAGVTVGFIIAAIAIGCVAFFVLRMNHQPSQLNRPSAHHSSIGDWAQPYHVQHPLTKAAAHQLPAPAGPQYDDTVTFTLKQPQRKWVAVDEVTR